MSAPASPTTPHPGLSFRGFVALIAMLMAVNALGIDSMLPALPAMGDALGIPHPNDRQWVISAYLLGFGVATLIYGPLADRFGRRPILIIPLLLYVVTSLFAAFAGDFTEIILARALQGVAAASTRVLATSIVRDCYQGRQMARVMSLTFIVFMIVPILAPSLGQLLLFVGPWRLIFVALAVFALTVALWAWAKLPETLAPENRRPLSVGPILAAARVVVSNRQAMGYTLASALVFGALFGFITSVQQIFTDVFGEPDIFPLAFAGIAGSMAVGSYFNSRIVERIGVRRVSHIALCGFILINAVHLLVVLSGAETIWTFALLQALTMGSFALAGSNFGSLAMAPVGHIAGTASSIQGFTTTVLGALLGLWIGQSFNGSTIPMTLGFLLLGIASFLVVLWVERGRLFGTSQTAAA